MPTEKQLANLKRFTSTYRPKNPGRKPNLLKKYINSGANLSSQDLSAVINTLLSMSREKLQEKAKDNKEPTIVCLVAMALLGDMSSKSTKNLDNLMKNMGLAPLPSLRNVTPETEVLPGEINNNESEQFAVYEYPALPESEVVDSEE